MELSEKLKQLRNEKGKTQQQACDEMDIAISSLRNYENGKIPDTVQLKIIKKYYDVSYEYLLDNECENKSEETLKIGKELGFSDEAINIIKTIRKNKDGLNYFIENCDFEDMVSYIKMYMDINQILEKDMYILELIEEFTDYIVKSKNNNKLGDLKDYFEECQIIIKRIRDFYYTTEFFEASDSKYDLFYDSFYSMVNDIFNKKYLDDSFEEDFICDLEEYMDLMNEIRKKYYNIRQMIKFNIIEIIQRFYYEMEAVSNTGLIKNEKFHKFLERYRKNSKKNNAE